MNTGQPLISIVIPVYNGANYMREAIDSALVQTYTNIEIIVVNDGSKDDGETERIALSYGDKIRYFYKENGGVSTALNLGIKNMKGEYFSWLSHDDKYTEDKIERQIEALSHFHGDNLVALCADRQINKKSEFIGTENIIKNFSLNDIISWWQVLYRMLDKGSMDGCAFLLPKSVFEVCGLFDETLRYNQDFFMWVKIFTAKYDLVYTSNVGVYNRVHDKQLTQTGRALFKKDSAKIADELAQMLASVENGKKLLFACARHNAKLGNSVTVKSCRIEAKKLGGFSFGQKVSLFIANVYGGMRPLIRKVYYRVFKKVKTQ